MNATQQTTDWTTQEQREADERRATREDEQRRWEEWERQQED